MQTTAAPEHIFAAWDEALQKHDLEATLALYAPDATLESPLVRTLMGEESGVVRGSDELRRFYERVYARQLPLRGHHRTFFFTDGKGLMSEYPRVTPSGEQMDFVEVMDLRGGRIQYHRVYWGWRGVKVLDEDRHHPE
jgi:ketosteroid isomerase-like protein